MTIMGTAVVVMLIIALLTVTICLLFTRTVGSDELPPENAISDEEFLAACSVKDPNIALKVRRVIAECSGVEERYIHPHHRLVADLGME